MLFLEAVGGQGTEKRICTDSSFSFFNSLLGAKIKWHLRFDNNRIDIGNSNSSNMFSTDNKIN